MPTLPPPPPPATRNDPLLVSSKCYPKKKKKKKKKKILDPPLILHVAVEHQQFYVCLLGQKKKLLCCPHPTKIWKLGRSVDFFFFTYRERVEFSNIFFKVSKWGKLGRNAVKTHIYKCFFKPLNTNFSKFFAQIWHKKKKKPTLFFRILRSVGRGQHNNFFFCPYFVLVCTCMYAETSIHM